ncbi:OmpA family protein [Flavobacterium sp. NST-5]|uniref:OmpA family protein n=1 Tax=Flavobacterium ichthyis TaxID=2698827 RepID=A0ABW9Z7X0_9FLAO|nr:OmpA family protein [Flavobacterium ichthyis]NBL64971.1 OmpA family protein [Flavobacterium ichthyis]
MIKKVTLAVVALAFMTSCVSSKVYKDLEGKYTNLKKENRALADENQQLATTKNQLENESADLKSQLAKLKSERDNLAADLAASKSGLDNLKASYATLEKNSGDALSTNMGKNRELIAQLDAKEKALAAEQERLNRLQSELRDRSARVDELESMIAAQEASMKRLKETLSNALNSFEGKGLTVEQKNGKVYVSMENKLLFGSGSWSVGTEGRRAVNEVGKVLAQNPDISVLIEGHTDNVPYNGSGQIVDNWDLSTKRATAIVNILAENKGIDKKNLTAAGRGEFAPLQPNSSAEAKAKNRRIEIILTPKLEEISRMLNEI